MMLNDLQQIISWLWYVYCVYNSTDDHNKADVYISYYEKHFFHFLRFVLELE